MTVEELARGHDLDYVVTIASTASTVGHSKRAWDKDTVLARRSCKVASRGAGAGLDAVARLVSGDASAAFLALRPLGHHTRRFSAMGFCVFNSLAVTLALEGSLEQGMGLTPMVGSASRPAAGLSAWFPPVDAHQPVGRDLAGALSCTA